MVHSLLDRSAEIKRAYYRAAKEAHPDTNKGDPQANAKFARVKAAAAHLSERAKKGR